MSTKMDAGVEYVLIRGHRWFPIGRLYKTLLPIVHYSGAIIPVGFTWDGGTGVPMRINDPSSYAFICHDYDFGSDKTNIVAANTQCVRQLANDTSLFFATIIAIAFTLLTPTLFGYFVAESIPKYKFIRWIAHLIAITNITILIWAISAIW